VGIQEIRVELEEELVEVLIRGDIAGNLGDLEVFVEACPPTPVEGGNALLDRARSRLELRGCARKEAATREDAATKVVQERVGQREHRRDAGLGRMHRADHDLIEDLLGRVDGGELELLLRAEVGVQPALAHPDVGGQVADR